MFSQNADRPVNIIKNLCDDGFTITLDKQEIPSQKNGDEIIKVTRNKKTGIWEVPLGTQHLKKCVKQHYGTYFKTRVILITTCSTFRPNYINYPQGNQTRFPEYAVVPYRKIIKKHLAKYRDTTMGYLRM